MGTHLSRIPGYGFLSGGLSLEPGRAEVMKRISEAVGKRNASRLDRLGRLEILPHFDFFPEAVRRRCFTLVPRPACVWSPDSGKIFVDASAAARPDFAGSFITEAGISAMYGALDRRSLDADLWILMLRMDRGSEEAALALAVARRCQPAFRPSDREGFYDLLHCLIETVSLDPRKYGYGPAARRRIVQFIEGKKAPESMKLTDFYALAMENAAELAGGAEPSLEWSFRDEGKRRLPLGAIAEPHLGWMPAPSVLGGGKAPECGTENLSPFPGCLDGVYRSDDLLSLDDADESFAQSLERAGPLASLKLRPMAEMRICTLGMTAGTDAPVRAGFVRPCISDFPASEVQMADILPFFDSVSRETVSIESAGVTPNLAWAVLSLSVETMGGTVLRALCPAWGLQASSLETGTFYEAAICLWAKRIARSSGEGPGFIRNSRTRDNFTDSRLEGVVAEVSVLGAAAGIELVHIACELGGERLRRFSVVAPKNVIKRKLEAGQRISATGIFTAGPFSRTEPEFAAIRRTLEGESNNRRQTRKLARMGLKERNGNAVMLAASRQKECGKRSRERRDALLRVAARWGQSDAIAMSGLNRLILRRREAMKKGTKPVVPDTGGIQRLCYAACRGSKVALDVLCFLKFASGAVSPVLRRCFIEKLAFEHHEPRALWELSQQHQAGEPDSPESIIRINLMIHSVLNGHNSGAFELARTCALGIGTAEDPESARTALSIAMERGCLQAHYWLGAYTFLGRRFFTMAAEEKRAAFIAEAKKGTPHAILLLALYFAYEDGGDDALLTACSLFSWLGKTIHDQESPKIREELLKKLDGKQREELPLFNVWRALGIEQPPVSVPLTAAMAEISDPPVIHSSIFRALGTNDREDAWEHIFPQLDFFNANSVDVSFGWAAENSAPQPKHLRLKAYTGGSPGGGHALMIASSRNPAGGSWDPGAFYAYFPDGEKTEITLQAARVSAPAPTTGAISFIIPGSAGPNTTYIAFDVFWPMMMLTYRTGESWKASICGVASHFEARKHLFDGLPENIVAVMKRDMARRPGSTGAGMMAFVRIPDAHATYHVNGEVRAVYPSWTEIAGITYARVEVTSPFTMEGVFPIYISGNLVEEHELPQAHERIDCIFDLFVHVTGRAETKAPVTLN